MLPGIKDSEFIRDKVPMTKEDIRILTICKGKIKKGDTVWDIGAGTGSISIEAAKIIGGGTVYAIEKKPLAIEVLKKNKEHFGIDNMEIIEKNAPEGLIDLPCANCIFIGGTGKNTEEILDICKEKLVMGGSIVANAITIQTMNILAEYFRKHKDVFHYEIIQVQVNLIKQIANYDMYEAQNPIFIITATKKG